MIKIEKEKTGNLIKVVASDTLTQEDYDQMLPILEKTLEEWKNLRLYFEMQNFTGWTVKAAYQDLKFDVKHATDFSKVAIVGEKKWQEAFSSLMKPFTPADIQYFNLEERDQALQWLKS